MIYTSTENVKEFVAKHKIDIVAMIVLAHEGERELLEKHFGDQAYAIVKRAKQYGETARMFSLNDYPISISEQGELIKQPYRLAGLIIAGQKEFMAVKCSRQPEPEPKFRFTKEEKEKLDSFFALLNQPADTLQAPKLSSPVKNSAATDKT